MMNSRPDESSIVASRFDEIANRYSQQLRAGQSPDVEDFVRENRDLEDRIRRLFPVLALMESDESSPSDWTEVNSIESVLTDYVEGNPDKQLGDFRIIREIGRGGMGIVYLAEQQSLGRQVALKLLPQSANFDHRRLKRFQQEARASAMLHHTNIVQIFDIGQHDGQSYLVMQRIEGNSLSEILTEMKSSSKGGSNVLSQNLNRATSTLATRVAGSLEDTDRSLIEELAKRSNESDAQEKSQAEEQSKEPVVAKVDKAKVDKPGNQEPEPVVRVGHESDFLGSNDSYFNSVAKVGQQVADALAHAHSKGVLHRDIKPSNLLVNDSSEVWVTDFGLAKMLGSPELTATGEIVGTLRYMSPEQLKGTADERSDIFGLGLTLYELLVMKPAYDSSDRESLIVQAMEAAPKNVQSLNSSIPLDLATIVHKCIQRDPKDRYSTAAEVSEDLQRFINDEPIKARPIGMLERTKRWCVRKPLVSCLAAGLILSLIAGIVGVTYQWQQTRVALNEAIENKRIADVALQEAIESKRVADEQSVLALDTLDDVIYEFSDLIQLSNSIPNAGKVKKNMAEIALKGLGFVSESLRERTTYHQTLIWAHVDLGDVYMKVGDSEFKDCRDDAMAEYERAYELVTNWLKAAPDSNRALKIHAEVLEKLGESAFMCNNSDEAMKWLEQGDEACEVVLEQVPDNEMTLYRRLRILRWKGVVEFRRFRLDEAIKHLKLAREQIDVMKRMVPGSEEGDVNDFYVPDLEQMLIIVENLPEVRNDISFAFEFDDELVPRLLYDCAAWQAYDGDHASAAKTLVKMSQLEVLVVRDCFHLSCGYCRCVKALLADRSVEDLNESEAELFDAYVEKAISNLEKTEELGLFDSSRGKQILVRDVDLDSIRDTDEFKTFFKAFQESTKR